MTTRGRNGPAAITATQRSDLQRCYAPLPDAATVANRRNLAHCSTPLSGRNRPAPAAAAQRPDPGRRSAPLSGRNRLFATAALALLATVLPSEWADAQRRERDPNAPPPGPVPRTADGKVMLTGATGSETGVWEPMFGIFDPIAPADEVPFQPWARALYDARQIHELEPHARCKASGISRQFLTPYGVEILEIPELKRLYIFDIGGPHTFRTVYMDGRSHPKNPTPTNYGHAIGWWEGDTLVIDSVGFNEDFWFERRGLPHTEQLHTIERLTRVDAATIEYRVTIDDPGAYTAPWTGGFDLNWEEGTELFEYICQEANYAHELMVGGEASSVDRSSPIVP